MKIAIQCLDGYSKKIGSFGYVSSSTVFFPDGEQVRLFYAETPIFNSVSDLFIYMKERGITHD